MRQFAVFNNQILSADNVALNLISPASFYGKSIFTTVAIYNSQPFLWEKHWQRVISNSKQIGIRFRKFSDTDIKDLLFEIIDKNSLINGRVRITFFDESSLHNWQNEQKQKISFLINTAGFRETPERFRLGISPFRTNSISPLCGVKSGNYLENILAFENAKENNFDEAVRVNERGEIVSACLSNIFWLKGEKIFTPGLGTGCLAGTTREFILENFPVKEVKTDLSELDNAETIFLTSAGIGIVQAAEFQGRKLDGKIHGLGKIMPVKTKSETNKEI